MTEPAANLDDPTHWPKVAALAADEKLATDTVIIDVADVLAITGYFVIATGNSARQVRAIADAVEFEVKQQGGPKPLRTEGRETFEWVLIDFGDFVVHVFDKDTRDHYALERLWKDRPKVAWQ